MLIVNNKLNTNGSHVHTIVCGNIIRHRNQFQMFDLPFFAVRLKFVRKNAFDIQPHLKRNSNEIEHIFCSSLFQGR